MALWSNEAEAVSTLRTEGLLIQTTVIPDELVAAYSATEYRVTSDDPVFVLQIGKRSNEIARNFELTGKDGATFITAENSFSQAASAEENAANQANLYKDLAATDAVIMEGAGQGEDPAWPAEASYLAIGISREQACELGRKYQQNAIVWIGPDAVPELVLLR